MIEQFYLVMASEHPLVGKVVRSTNPEFSTIILIHYDGVVIAVPSGYLLHLDLILLFSQDINGTVYEYYATTLAPQEVYVLTSDRNLCKINLYEDGTYQTACEEPTCTHIWHLKEAVASYVVDKPHLVSLDVLSIMTQLHRHLCRIEKPKSATEDSLILQELREINKSLQYLIELMKPQIQ